MSLADRARRALYRFRSSITGRWVSEAEAKQHPDTTQRERVDRQL